MRKVIGTHEFGVFTANYTYDGNKLTQYVDTYGEKDVYVYTGELLTEVKEYEDDVLMYITTLEYDANKRLITETSKSLESTSENVYKYTYNADGSIITVNENDEEEYNFTFLNGNRISENYSNEARDCTYTYDDKNNPFVNVHQREVLDLLGSYASKNNISTYTNTGGATNPENLVYTQYIYNSDNFPVSVTETYRPGSAYEEVTNFEFIYE